MHSCLRKTWHPSAAVVARLALGAALLWPPHASGADQAAEAAKLKNPVRADAASVAAGKKLYGAQCALCHGAAGKGDGKGGALLKPKPFDLTDREWTGSVTDGDIFVTIRDGVKQTGMRAFGGKIATQDIWHLVNYLRTLGPKPAPSH